MAAFKARRPQLLVATTVIEVGVDVPNASLMIIENAERMGLAQLHQLRGRVGPGRDPSHCVLLYRPPLSLIGDERLGVMRETNDGFVVAEKDLELRGPGECSARARPACWSTALPTSRGTPRCYRACNRRQRPCSVTRRPMPRQSCTAGLSGRGQYGKV